MFVNINQILHQYAKQYRFDSYDQVSFFNVCRTFILITRMSNLFATLLIMLEFP